jgi:hypothetical protein
MLHTTRYSATSLNSHAQDWMRLLALLLKIKRAAKSSAWSPRATCATKWPLMTVWHRKSESKKSCVPRTHAAARMSPLKMSGANSTSIRRRVCPLWTAWAIAAVQSAPTIWTANKRAGSAAAVNPGMLEYRVSAIETAEDDRRLDLLHHQNVRMYRTISNTVAAVTKLEGVIKRKT